MCNFFFDHRGVPGASIRRFGDFALGATNPFGRQSHYRKTPYRASRNGEEKMQRLNGREFKSADSAAWPIGEIVRAGCLTALALSCAFSTLAAPGDPVFLKDLNN